MYGSTSSSEFGLPYAMRMTAEVDCSGSLLYLCVVLWTSLTSFFNCKESVPGNTPCPKLKTCPRRPFTLDRISVALVSTSVQLLSSCRIVGRRRLLHGSELEDSLTPCLTGVRGDCSKTLIGRT